MFVESANASLDALCQRLAIYGALTDHEREAVLALPIGAPRQIAARKDVLREGDAPRGALLLLSGWASCYKMLEDGRRQTLTLLLPGDLHGFGHQVLRELDHSVSALTPITVAEVAFDQLLELGARFPPLHRAMIWQALTEAALGGEWTLNLGQRSALERIGHFFCETYHRLRAIGLADEDGCDMPMTQVDLSEATGLTSVHDNRTLQEMRATGLILLRNRRLDFPDLPRLEQVAMFQPGYLHMQPAAVR